MWQCDLYRVMKSSMDESASEEIITKIKIEHFEYFSRTYSSGTSSTSMPVINMTHRYSAPRVFGSMMDVSLMIGTLLGTRSKIQFSNVNIQLKIKNSKVPTISISDSDKEF